MKYWPQYSSLFGLYQRVHYQHCASYWFKSLLLFFDYARGILVWDILSRGMLHVRLLLIKFWLQLSLVSLLCVNGIIQSQRVLIRLIYICIWHHTIICDFSLQNWLSSRYLLWWRIKWVIFHCHRWWLLPDIAMVFDQRCLLQWWLRSTWVLNDFDHLLKLFFWDIRRRVSLQENILSLFIYLRLFGRNGNIRFIAAI